MTDIERSQTAGKPAKTGSGEKLGIELTDRKKTGATLIFTNVEIHNRLGGWKITTATGPDGVDRIVYETIPPDQLPKPTI